MRYRDLAQRQIASEIRGVEEHLEVHHIVDDHLEHVRIHRVPATRAADDGAEASRECSGKCLYCQQGCIIFRVSGVYW